MEKKAIVLILNLLQLTTSYCESVEKFCECVKQIDHAHNVTDIEGPLVTVSCTDCGYIPLDWIPLDTHVLHLDSNNLQYLTKLTNLTVLLSVSMQENQISSITDGAFVSCELLESLQLSHNHLARIERDAFEGLVSLRDIDLSYNWIPALLDYTFEVVKSTLVSVNLSHNRLIALGLRGLSGLTRLEIIDLSYNGITSLRATQFNFLFQLKSLLLSHNRLTNLTPLFIFDTYTFEKLDVSHNEIEKISDDAFTGMVHMKSLNLSHNHIKALSNDFGRLTLVELEELYLDFNPLLRITGLPHNLKTLSLSNCPRLEALQKRSFCGLRNLKHITITDNERLSSIDDEAFDLQDEHLDTVDLSNNDLDTLSMSALPWSNIRHTDLSGNPWHCDCRVQWMLLFEANVKQHIRCNSPPHLRGRVMTELIADQLKCEDSYWVPWLVTSILALVVVILAVVTVYVFKNRHKLRRPSCLRRERIYNIM